ncbi:YitT family protein [Parachitinimonas caeni]|uniref:YitT family protein n=1 Tax=Parachitinimonas caeni TaxID=3031301 RepID=A0ABT7E059_9NEIS|nr:YitT family protein [Parachitinimonas caeni]MDK2125689.1 YitT family protein [Parachitinimonas caeni]
MSEKLHHTLSEDIQALLIGSLNVALSVQVFKYANLQTGGTAGLAFLGHYLSHLPFGWIFFVINLPFYLFAWKAMGWPFTLKTFSAVALLSLYSELLPHWISFGHLNPWFAGILGGLLAGNGILILARHKASLGGVGVLALYLQETRGWRAGKLQMGADVLILLSAASILDPIRMAISILGAVTLNLVIAVNHRPGRYIGM